MNAIRQLIVHNLSKQVVKIKRERERKKWSIINLDENDAREMICQENASDYALGNES